MTCYGVSGVSMVSRNKDYVMNQFLFQHSVSRCRNAVLDSDVMVVWHLVQAPDTGHSSYKCSILQQLHQFSNFCGLQMHPNASQWWYQPESHEDIGDQPVLSGLWEMIVCFAFEQSANIYSWMNTLWIEGTFYLNGWSDIKEYTDTNP